MMSIIKYIVAYSFILCPLYSIAQDNFICWTSDTKLNWSDFQGPVPDDSRWSAVCSAELLAKGYRSGNLPNFRITNRFDRDVSWTNDTTSIDGLKHEQLHFDIAEIHARRMRKSVDSLRQLNVRSFDPYSEIIQKLLARRNRIDSIYDKETAHSLLLDEQSLWEEKIWRELDSLSKYATVCDEWNSTR